MFYDPIGKRIIDYVHGRADIRSRTVRTIGPPDDRFAEDKLRLLRAVRFACNLGFTIEPATWEAGMPAPPGKSCSKSGADPGRAPQILTGPDPARGLDLLRDSSLLRWILPEVEATRECPSP